jgi:hypothetical protein
MGMWQMEHLSSMAAAAVGWSIVSRRTPACQYGSRAELAIMDDRQAKPMETSSPVGATSWLWQPMQRSAVRNSESAVAVALCPVAGDPLPTMNTTIAQMLRIRRIGLPFRMVGSYGSTT